METTLIYLKHKDGSYSVVAHRTDGEWIETRNIFEVLRFIANSTVTDIIYADALA